MPTRAETRGRKVAEEKNRNLAGDLIRWLNARLVDRGVVLNTDEQEAVRDWMSSSFHRGIERGKALQRRLVRRGGL